MLDISILTTNTDFISIFSSIDYSQNDRNGMLLTEQIGAKNFRIRESKPGYITDWHLSGDSTFISVLQGVLRIELQNGTYKDFSAGQMFVAADNLPEEITFDSKVHGHRAMVVGTETLVTVHIKLQEDIKEQPLTN